jgi:uncharacterized membrane protein YphA (DoxX/SURF4 family)
MTGKIRREPNADTPRVYLGRHVLGLAAILFGVLAFVWRDFNDWQQAQPFKHIAHREALVCFIGAIEVLGGLAIQWRKTARAGATAIGSVFLFFTLLWVPRIVAQPRVFDRWGNFFEQFSQVAGALIVYAVSSGSGSRGRSNSERNAKLARMGYFFFAICVVSFTLAQIIYFRDTADFVPKWIPPGQVFWAVMTTIAFALATIALFSGWAALLASRLLTAMIIGFGLLIWLPAPFTKPFADSYINWAGNAENLAIAAAAWIVADYLSQKRSASAAAQ